MVIQRYAAGRILLIEFNHCLLAVQCHACGTVSILRNENFCMLWSNDSMPSGSNTFLSLASSDERQKVSTRVLDMKGWAISEFQVEQMNDIDEVPDRISAPASVS